MLIIHPLSESISLDWSCFYFGNRCYTGVVLHYMVNFWLLVF